MCRLVYAIGKIFYTKAVFGSNLEEGMEDRLWIFKVIVNNVYEEKIVHHVLNQFARYWVHFIDARPPVPEFKSLVLNFRFGQASPT